MPSYMHYYTYEYLIVSKLNFSRISKKLLEAKLIQEDELCSISNAMYSKSRQNTRLLRILFDERREFYPFLEILKGDRDYAAHADLTRNILARHISKADDQPANETFDRKHSTSYYGEWAHPKCCEYRSGSDSSIFTYDTQDSIDSNTGSEEERKGEREIVELTNEEHPQRELPVKGFQNSVYNREIQKKSGIIPMFVFVLFIVLAIMMMPLKICKFAKFIPVK